MAGKTYIVTAAVYGRVRRIGAVRAVSAAAALRAAVDSAWAGAYGFDVADIRAVPARRVRHG